MKSPPGRLDTFADAMAREGAVPLGGAVARVPPAKKSSPRSVRPSAATFHVERDDEWVEGYRIGISGRERSRLRAQPMATLDLHRHDAESARRRTVRFIADARAKRQELVLIVVGRGRHSPGGYAVLRSEIADWLTTPPTASHVLAFRTAPPELGGSGGVLVLLAPH
ncbi:MAG TPA: Smr/MutS family protein [Polyangiaceae bacterium]